MILFVQKDGRYALKAQYEHRLPLPRVDKPLRINALIEYLKKLPKSYKICVYDTYNNKSTALIFKYDDEPIRLKKRVKNWHKIGNKFYVPKILTRKTTIKRKKHSDA